MAIHKEKRLTKLLNFHSLEHGQLIVATDGEGDNDPECTKSPVTSMHYGRPDISTNFTRYLMGLESRTRKEIHIEVPVERDYLLNFAKLIIPSWDKLSWHA